MATLATSTSIGWIVSRRKGREVSRVPSSSTKAYIKIMPEACAFPTLYTVQMAGEAVGEERPMKHAQDELPQ